MQRGTTSAWHVSNFYFFQYSKKSKKSNEKIKIKKIQELTCDTPLMMLRTWLHQISQNKDQIEIRKNRETKLIFCYENGNQRHN